MALANKYWYIKIDGQIRCERATTPQKACAMAYETDYRPLNGQHYRDDFPCPATYKEIGTRRPATLSQKLLQELQGPDGWKPVWAHRNPIENGFYRCTKCSFVTKDPQEMTEHERCNNGHNMEFVERPATNGIEVESVSVGEMKLTERGKEIMMQEAGAFARKYLLDNAIECTRYVASGKCLARDLVEKYNLTEQMAQTLLAANVAEIIRLLK